MAQQRSPKERIDRLLVSRGLVATRSRAQALVMAGKVVADGHRIDKAGAMVPSNADIRLRGEDHPYVSRGGLKLEGALRTFGAPEHEPRLEVQGRVAIGDAIGAALGAEAAAVLIGERPGLSAPDSLGLYLTWNPRPGRTDAERNCISNIRPAGQPYAHAAETLAWLVGEMRRRCLTGVELKDERPAALSAPEASERLSESR